MYFLKKGDYLTLIKSFFYPFLILFSFYLTFKSGQRGFFPFDQSIVFDGAYRIICGQIPYRDFVIPIGPVTFYIQALFFRIFGVNYFSYILSAACLNVAGAVCAALILRILFPEKRILSYIAGIITSIWFCPIHGTFYYDQLAFFFCSLTVVIMLYISKLSDINLAQKKVLVFLCGCISFIAFITKQNAGLISLIFCIIFFVAISFPFAKKSCRNILIFFSGYALSAIVFIVWLFRVSRIDIFMRHFFAIPARTGFLRIFDNPYDFLKIVIFGAGQLLAANIIFVSMIISVFIIFYHFKIPGKHSANRRRNITACFICIYFVLFQNLFIATTYNEPENSLVFMGIIFAVALGVLIDNYSLLSSTRKDTRPVPGFIIIGILVLGICAEGMYVSLSRYVQNGFKGSSFPKNVAIKKLSNLKWGKPTRINGEGVTVDEADFLNTHNFLKKSKKNFFIFPDYTIFYGLLNVPSPQPLVWFHRGLTYPFDYDVKVDNWIVGGLKNNSIEFIIIEEDSFIGSQKRLSHFPELARYISSKFTKDRSFGIFSVYRRKR
ncbi:MAG: hypothetical protein ABH872_07025 [Candidatus Omnitrophota bacterium]